jgi:hypothetical protein
MTDLFGSSSFSSVGNLSAGKIRNVDRTEPIDNENKLLYYWVTHVMLYRIGALTVAVRKVRPKFFVVSKQLTGGERLSANPHAGYGHDN